MSDDRSVRTEILLVWFAITTFVGWSTWLLTHDLPWQLRAGVIGCVCLVAAGIGLLIPV